MSNEPEKPDEPRLFRLEGRIKSFERTWNINGKRCNWPYRVIPHQAMANLGFYYHPTCIDNDNTVKKDCVCCIYCGQLTYNFHDCRTKPLVSTLGRILEKHLNESPNCLLAQLRLVLMRSITKENRISIDWANAPIFQQPHSDSLIRFRAWTFKNNWPYRDSPLSQLAMAQAGLLRYDHNVGYPSLPAEYRDATYCIYCNKIIGSWENDDDPLWEHYLCCNGGKCFFFETINDITVLSKLNDRFTRESTQIMGAPLPSLDYSELLKAKIDKLEEILSSEEMKPKRGRPRKISIISETQAGVPKKRGRPRKVLPPTDSTEGKDNIEPSFEKIKNGSLDAVPELLLVKRRRGRPRKSSSAAALQNEPKIARKEGQPRKTVFSKSSNEESLSSSLEGTPNSETQQGAEGENHGSGSDQSENRVERQASISQYEPLDALKSTDDLHAESSHTLNLKKEVDLTKKEHTEKAAATVPVSPRKKIRLKKHTKIINNETELTPDESDSNSTKSIVLNFKPKQSKEPQKNNPIIDDSFDAFSFSNQGNSEFIIPDSAFTIHSAGLESGQLRSNSTLPVTTSTGTDTGSPYPDKTPSPEFKSQGNSNGRLNDIDLDISMSEDSEDEQSISNRSTPLQSPLREDAISSSITLSQSSEKDGRNQENTSNSRKASIKDFIIDDINTTGSSSASSNSRSPSIVQTAHKGNSLQLIKPMEQNGHMREANLISRSFEIDSMKAQFQSQESNDGIEGLVLSEERVNEPNEESTSIFELPKETDLKEASNFLNRNIEEKDAPHSDQDPRDSVKGKNDDDTPSEFFDRIDEKRLMVQDYFHNLLKYMNKNLATLANDKDGDLNFFVNHMPAGELNMTYKSWIDKKKEELMQEFDIELNRKLERLENEFQKARKLINNIEDDDILLKVAKQYFIPIDK
ncbi:LAFE_0B10330g1_1 [Lachancea fermentati]|uniref:LAFE_0B10330g1_1 n=1 Tax=Lachancea fermentati TaxID=4955 RepID=A0A1G4M8G6_LACFM|nr:LAFE_0B10330g1_1 [Lachancea fermentati]